MIKKLIMLIALLTPSLAYSYSIIYDRILEYTTDTLGTDESGVILCDTSSADVTITLPAVSGNAGLTYTIKKISASNTCTVDGNASETIDGATTKDLVSNYAFIKIVTDGDEWHIVASNIL